MTFTDDLTFIPRAADGIGLVPSGGIANGELCVCEVVGTHKRASSGLLEASKALNMMEEVESYSHVQNSFKRLSLVYVALTYKNLVLPYSHYKGDQSPSDEALICMSVREMEQ